MGRLSLKTPFSIALILLIYLSTVSGKSSPPTCSSYAFSNKNTYATCVSLPVLDSYLHWIHNVSAGTADIAFRATALSVSPPGNWAAWALNPTGSGMIGAQALVAYKNANGEMRAYTSSVQSMDISTLVQSRLSFDVTDLKAESSDSQIIIYATIKLPGNKTTVNHVWQVGPLSNGLPAKHAMDNAHLGSSASIDFSTGVASVSRGGNSRLGLKNAHGVLNAVSWGVMMPIGAIIARYVKVLKPDGPMWFNLHITCQSVAYLVGVVGWGIGIKLGSDSKGITYHEHRNIGIALFCLATVQVSAHLLRPNKDHKYRLYWNIYHWSVGYSVIVLSIINVFEGLDILDPEKKWKTSYTVLIVVLSFVALLLEATTWVIVLRRKKDDAKS